MALPKVRRLTAPTEYPVSLTELKEQLALDHAIDDALLSRLIDAATNHTEVFTETSIVKQQLRLTLDSFSSYIELPLGPVKEIQQVTYIDIDGIEQTVSSSIYTLDEDVNLLMLDYGQTWPNARYQKNAVKVDYWAGFYDATVSPVNLTSEIPAGLKQAILMVAADFYRLRESQSDIATYSNPAFEMLVHEFRNYV